MSLGTTICKLRKAKGYTQRRLAQEISVTVTCISFIETGHRLVSEKTLDKIGVTLGIPSLFIRCLAASDKSPVLKKIKKLIKETYLGVTIMGKGNNAQRKDKKNKKPSKKEQAKAAQKTKS